MELGWILAGVRVALRIGLHHLLNLSYLEAELELGWILTRVHVATGTGSLSLLNLTYLEAELELGWILTKVQVAPEIGLHRISSSYLTWKLSWSLVGS